MAGGMTHRLANLRTACQALALLAVLAPPAAARLEARATASEYISTTCADYATAYVPLVEHYLSQFQGGFSTADILQLPAMYNGTRLQKEYSGASPLLYILDGEVLYDSSLPRPGGKRLKNLEYFGIPVLQQLSQLAVLPDMAIRYSPFDEPLHFTGVDAAPWFGYCTVPQQQRMLMLPDTLRQASLKCLGSCQAGPLDTRIPNAVFLGTPTGWEKGKRKAVLRAGLQSPEHVYSGLIGDPGGLLSPDEARMFQLHPPLPLHDQVAQYKYVVNVEGNCAALRLKYLLAGPSAVFFVQSDEIEWFYPLLKPFVHYIPVTFSTTGVGEDFEVDLVEKVAWAEKNPDRIERIVRAANAFARKYLSKQGQQCFAMQMLDRYARMLRDPWRLRKMRHRAEQVVGLMANTSALP